MKRALFILLVLLFLTVLSPANAEETAATVPEASDEASASTDVTPWTDVMRLYLEKFGSCADEAEIESVLSSRTVDPSKPMIALTFDDGPVAGVTDRILDILEEYNARATFFVMGCRLKKEANAEILPRMLALGCEIGNHTYNHERLKNSSAKYQKLTNGRVNDAVCEITGFTPTSLRPPGGMTADHVIKAAGEIGMTVIMWSQSADVRKTDPESIANNVFRQTENGRELQSGDIVLLHDTKKYMVEAVDILIPRLIEAGYQLVTVRELLSYSEIGYQSGYQYKSLGEYKTYER